jgi:universal stress protein A
MSEFRKILVGIDFSEHSQRALDEAVGLAQQFGAEVTLFHCFELPIPAFGRHPSATVPPESYVDAVREAALQSIRLWGEMAKEKGVRVKEEISAGFAANEIAVLAEKIRADLIVIGTRGRTGFKHVLLGSVAERTIRLAPCPVLTVKVDRIDTP